MIPVFLLNEQRSQWRVMSKGVIWSDSHFKVSVWVKEKKKSKNEQDWKQGGQLGSVIQKRSESGWMRKVAVVKWYKVVIFYSEYIHILKEDPTGFVDELGLRERGVKNDSKVSTGRTELPFTEMKTKGGTSWKRWFKNSAWGMLSLRCLLDIQTENSRRNWIYKSGVKGEVRPGDTIEISIWGLSAQRSYSKPWGKMRLPSRTWKGGSFNSLEVLLNWTVST